MKENKILFIGPVASRSGYGEHAREVADYLCKWDVDFLVTSWGDNPMTALENEDKITKKIKERIVPKATKGAYDVCIHLGMPTEFQKIGNYNIGITAGVETDRCSVQFLKGCNAVDLVIVPSDFTKSTFLNTECIEDGKQIKCTTPIEVISETVNPAFHYMENPNSDTLNSKLNVITEDFCFMFVGQWVSSQTDDGGRKNVNSLISTFCETFKNESNPPALVLKTNGIDFSLFDEVNTRQLIESVTDNFENPPSIYLIHGELTEHEMASLYNHPKIKCHISHTRGEGFGRPLLEASLSGKPVIAPKWSGHLDFLPKKNNLLIPGKMKSVGVVNSLFADGAQWFDVDVERSRELMKDVYVNYDKHQKRAIALADDNLEKFSRKSIFNIYDNIFNQYIPPKKREVELKLPNIKKLPT